MEEKIVVVEVGIGSGNDGRRRRFFFRVFFAHIRLGYQAQFLFEDRTCLKALVADRLLG